MEVEWIATDPDSGLLSHTERRSSVRDYAARIEALFTLGEGYSHVHWAEARITLGVVAACRGDLDQAIHYGERALTAPRRSLPSLLMVSRDLTRVLNGQYPKEPETQACLGQLHALRWQTDS